MNNQRTTSLQKVINTLFKYKALLYLFLVLIAVSGIFIDLGQRQITSESEARFAMIGREIVQSNNPKQWLIQKLNDEIYYSKPPLYPALIALSYTAWGRINEFSALFPSALFAAATLIVCFLFWKRFFGLNIAVLSSIILATSYKFVDEARSIHVDMVLLFFITSALIAAFIYLNKSPSLKWSCLFFICCAFASLTKGPIGFLLPAMVIVLYAVYSQKISQLFSKKIAIGLGLFLSVMGIWLIFLWLYAPEGYIYNLFIRENFIRYTDAFDHKKGFFYYLGAFPKDFLPWIIFLPFLLFSKKWKQNNSPYSLSFFWIWFISIFLFFTFSEAKRGIYLLPLYPAIALLLGNGWSYQTKRWESLLMVFAVVFTLTCPIILDKYFDLKEIKERNPENKIKIIRETVGGEKIITYDNMEPVILFYMKRPIPRFNQLDLLYKEMRSNEKTYLLMSQSHNPEAYSKLKKDWLEVLKMDFSDKEYSLFLNYSADLKN